MNLMSTEKSVDRLVRHISRNRTTLEGLTQTQLLKIAKLSIQLDLVEKLRKRIEVQQIDYKSEKNVFLNSYRCDSTRESYTYALRRAEKFSIQKGGILFLEPKDADDFLYSLDWNSPSTVRSIAACCSSFFTFLERRHPSIRNPFRGTKARPRITRKRPLEIPSRREILLVIQNAPDILTKAALTILWEHGLRVGALETLSLHRGFFTALSKGRMLMGIVSSETKKALKGLPKRPFQHLTSTKINYKIRRTIEKLHKKRKISVRFSCHDIRHAFAIREYRKDKDILRVKNLLGHCNLHTTDNYLEALLA